MRAVELISDGGHLNIYDLCLRVQELSADLGYEVFVIFFLIGETITYWQNLLTLEPVFITYIQKRKISILEEVARANFTVIHL